ncbi:MAG: phosphotransacetylase [Endomicrobium sp.]|nr:phosphotransacetylase [Endomicrobium sp.]
MRKQILQMAKKAQGKIILPESFDIRILKAASMLTKNSVASVVLPTNNLEEVKSLAQAEGIDLKGIEIIAIDRSLLDNTKVKSFVDARMKKGMSEQEASDLLKNPLFFSMMYLKSGKCNACVGGAVYDSADVLRAAIYVVGMQEGLKMMSSYFLMIPPENHPIIKGPLMFADCAVNPEPQALGLQNIAVSSVASYKKIFPEKTANVAMLSFSTKGSAKNKMLSKVIEATELTKKYFKGNKSVNIDGELQFDASILPNIAKRKAPDSLVAGNANIFIFPDLNAGNIAYKVAERLGGFQAVGPILQGLALPVSDLSRGSSFEDIYLISAVMLLK